MQKKWHLKTVDSARATQLSGALGISLIAARILVGRGVDESASVAAFLAPSLSAMPDPYLLKGMEAAVGRLMLARATGEKVCIYGDYDVDGISGTALLVSFLKAVDMRCSYFIPNRFDDGYGLNEEALQRIVDSGAGLVMSVDCGITAVAEAEFCKRIGVDLIILDHHAPKERIPDAAAVVNPLQPGCSYPFKQLAGVGVAFNLLVALRGRMRQEGVFSNGTQEPDLRNWLDLVALGTIADVVPLVGQNRTYVFYGLQKLENSIRPGIVALKKVAGIKTEEVSCGQVGFRLAPRLNAAGRMESAVPGVDLLLSENVGECAQIADELDAANGERQTIERSILEQAVAMVENGNYPDCRSLVLASRNWHQGVIGIVASRLVERYHRPTILLAIDEDGTAKGSGRSIPGFHLLEAITSASEYLHRFGGHRFAAGVGLSADRVESFAVAFETAACAVLGDSELVPTLEVDVEVQPDEVNGALVDELKKLEPFGAGNPEPTLMLRGVSVVDRRIVGDGHLKLRLSAGGWTYNAIAFRQAECPTDGVLDIAFFPEFNSWNNSTTLQLRIKAIRTAEA
jgi:single-stranded-DNA-specific exonuclease